MPRIAELRIIEGSVWARLEFDEHVGVGKIGATIITIYTPEELNEFRESIRKDILRTINELDL